MMPKLARRRTKPAGGNGEPALFDAATVKLWNSRSSTTARLVRALDNATAKPICDGGLAPYFVSEAHRRAAQEPRTAATPYAALAIAAIPASHRGRGDLEERCSVCLDGGKSADPEETLTLMCNHKFHRRCILRWLAVTIVCPYCRAQVASLEPYRYPARTALRSTFLRERIDHIVDWQQVSFKTRLPTAMLAVASHAARECSSSGCKCAVEPLCFEGDFRISSSEGVDNALCTRNGRFLFT